MKALIHIDMLVLVIIAVVVIVAVVILIMNGVINPGGDIAKNVVLRTCCQASMPLTCTTSSDAIMCNIPQNMISSFCGSDKCPLSAVAGKVNVVGDANIKKFCGCS
ncbi:MAG: hypothetical protein V1731_01935 [Candidatus Aenigmatarchaeota archaeon]